MEYFQNMGTLSIVLISAYAIIGFSLVCAINVFSDARWYFRIIASTILMGIPLLMWETLDDAVGWPKAGLPEDFFYIAHDVIFDDTGTPTDIAVMLRRIEKDQHGYDLRARKPRLHIVVYSLELGRQLAEARQRRGEGDAQVFSHEERAEGEPGTQPHFDDERHLRLRQLNLRPKGLLQGAD